MSAVVGPVYINLHPECELAGSNDFRDKQEVLLILVSGDVKLIHNYSQHPFYLRVTVLRQETV